MCPPGLAMGSPSQAERSGPESRGKTPYSPIIHYPYNTQDGRKSQKRGAQSVEGAADNQKARCTQVDEVGAHAERRLQAKWEASVWHRHRLLVCVDSAHVQARWSRWLPPFRLTVTTPISL